MYCMQCGSEIPPGISACPSCARQVTGSTAQPVAARSVIPPNRKRLVWIASGVLILLVILYVAGGGSGLSKSKAEQAIFQWQIGAWVCRCGGSCTGSGGLPVSVTGVQEMPQQNSARAVLAFENAPINHSCPGERMYTGPGEAIFNRFTDGRWLLARISTSEGINSFVWDNLNIPVK
jgi:hypothetical protein